jgi:hypothetical protein
MYDIWVLSYGTMYDKCFGPQPFEHRNLRGRCGVVSGDQRVRTKPPPRICAKDRKPRANFRPGFLSWHPDLAGRIMRRDFWNHYFGKHKRLTKDRCEEFFSNDANFIDV